MKSGKVLQDTNYLVNSYNPEFVVYESAKGSTLKAVDGKSYLDFTSGDSVCSMGYDASFVTDAIQKNTLIYSPNLNYTPQKGEAAAAICKASGMDRIFFSDNYREAQELSIRFARRLYPESENRYKAIVVKALPSDGKIQGGFLPSNVKIKYGETVFGGYIVVTPNDIKGFKAACADKNVCAVYISPADYFQSFEKLSPQFVQAVKELSQQKKLTLIVDENDTAGRSEDFCAYQSYDVSPDIVCLGKNLSCGIPFGAICVKKSLAGKFDCASENFSFRGHPVSCVVATSAVKFLVSKAGKKQIGANVKSMSAHLEKLRKFNNVVKKTSVLGYACSLEFVDNIAAASVKQALKEAGLRVNTLPYSNSIMLLPCFTAVSGDIAKGFKIIHNFCAAASKGKI